MKPKALYQNLVNFVQHYSFSALNTFLKVNFIPDKQHCLHVVLVRKCQQAHGIGILAQLPIVEVEEQVLASCELHILELDAATATLLHVRSQHGSEDW
jgi:hypothetical protein